MLKNQYYLYIIFISLYQLYLHFKQFFKLKGQNKYAKTKIHFEVFYECFYLEALKKSSTKLNLAESLDDQDDNDF